jgi:predicted enzyme related to lactoylglutathione lyase
MDLGEHFYCLKVRNLEHSIEFYEKLDFKIVEDHRPENWAVLQHNNLALCLYEGHIENNLINFRGGDIETIHMEAAARGLEFSKPALQSPDGSWSAELIDPDGNVIFLNTFPAEREQYVRTGKLIDY